MKKVLLSFSAVIVAAMILVSCSKNNPKDVAQAWLNSFYQMDYENAKKFSTDDTKSFISTMQGLSAMMPDSSKKEMKKVTVTIKDVKEEGDKATVTYITSSEANKEQTVKMVKKDGKWLVQFSKSDSMGSDASSEADKSAADTTGAAPGGATEAPAADTAAKQ